MSHFKLFGSYHSAARLPKNRELPIAQAQPGADDVAVAVEEVPAKRSTGLKILAFFLGFLLMIEICYFLFVYSGSAFFTKWRTIYIETAMDTLNHKYLATSIIPGDIIQDVLDQRAKALAEQMDLSSNWEKDDQNNLIENSQKFEIDVSVVDEEEAAEEAAKAAFYSLFFELDKESFEAYIEKNPNVLDDGWDNIYINEAGLKDKGTSIKTVHDEQVLAIDAANKVLLVRVEGDGYIGVLAKAKDPAQLSVYPSSRLGSSGENAGVIAEANNGILSMTGSGFIDPNGNGNGGILAGYAMCDGKAYGNAHMGWGYKRLELHEDNLMYIKDAGDPVGKGTTDAVEFQPALIIDGKIVVDSNCGWTGLHPRACIGQSDKYEILMLVIEGRMPGRSVGTHVIECAEILKRHGCMQAMNLDGGTSAIMWYDGEYVTKCSNQSLPAGRPLPTAFVYKRSN